jgi:hypothetical protein
VSSVADGMRLVSQPREFDPRGESPDTSRPEYETICRINEATLLVNEANREGASRGSAAS